MAKHKQIGRAAAAAIERLEGRTLMSAALRGTPPARSALESSEGIVTRPAVSVLPPRPLAAPALTASGGPVAQQGQPGFQITVVFPDNSLTQPQKDVFTIAANRWQQIITGDVPDDHLPGGTFVDDVQIEATGPAIDGVGGILGQAGPTELRDNTFLPAEGIMQFDSADLANLEANGSLTNVIIHEMSHVLGYGTIWSFLNLATGTGGADPRFTGAAATAEYQSVFGAIDETSVPLENTGNPGTRDVHWRESTFGPELLTGFLDNGVVPVSRVSAAQFIDLGYPGVVVSAADNFLPPLRLTNVSATGGSVVIPGSSVTLTATTSDTNGVVTDVSFFRESNGIAGLQSTGANPDTLLGNDPISADGFTINASTIGLPSGRYRFYARALDSDGDHSAAGTGAVFASVGVAIAGDITLNGTVGPEDFNILATHFGQGGQTWTTGDFTGNGTVGPEDFNLLATHFGESLPAGLVAGLMVTNTTSSLSTTPATTATKTTTSSVRISVLRAPKTPTPSKPRLHEHR